MDELHPDDKHKYVTVTTYRLSDAKIMVPLPGELCQLCGRKVPKRKAK